MRRFASVLFLGGTVFLSMAPAAVAAPSWRCEPRLEGDGICDCGCGRRDVDCSGETFEMCERSGCPEGQVPWEHAPDSCMTSACGDGWVDPAANEACDDGEALAGGGCNADCSAVNAGWVCHELADKCEQLPVDLDAGSATGEDAGAPVDGDAGPAVDADSDADADADGGSDVDLDATDPDGEGGDIGPAPDAGPGSSTDSAAASDDAAGTNAGGGGAGGTQASETAPADSGCGAAGGAVPWLFIPGLAVLSRRRVRAAAA